MMSTSTATAVLRYLPGGTIAAAVQIIVAALAVGMVVSAAYRQVNPNSFVLLLATCTFLIVPYAFNYDMTVMMIGAFAMMVRGDLTPLERRGASLGFMAPVLGMALAALGFPLMPLLVLLLALVQYRVGVRDARGAVSPDRVAPAAAAAAH